MQVNTREIVKVDIWNNLFLHKIPVVTIHPQVWGLTPELVFIHLPRVSQNALLLVEKRDSLKIFDFGIMWQPVTFVLFT